MNTYQANRYTQFITPLGGIIALICFFLPWAKINIDSYQISKTLSGLMCARDATLIAIAFVSCLLIICLSLDIVIRGTRQTSWKSKGLILINSIVGLSGMWSEYRTYMGLAETLAEEFQFTLLLGCWGTVIGLIVAAVGMPLIKGKGT